MCENGHMYIKSLFDGVGLFTQQKTLRVRIITLRFIIFARNKQEEIIIAKQDPIILRMHWRVFAQCMENIHFNHISSYI